MEVVVCVGLLVFCIDEFGVEDSRGFSLLSRLAVRRLGFGKIDLFGEFFSIRPGLDVPLCVGAKFNRLEEFLTLFNALSNFRRSYPIKNIIRVSSPTQALLFKGTGSN